MFFGRSRGMRNLSGTGLKCAHRPLMPRELCHRFLEGFVQPSVIPPPLFFEESLWWSVPLRIKSPLQVECGQFWDRLGCLQLGLKEGHRLFKRSNLLLNTGGSCWILVSRAAHPGSAGAQLHPRGGRGINRGWIPGRIDTDWIVLQLYRD